MEKTVQNGQAAKPDTIWKWLYRVLQGAIIGTGAILPGISGGALCVVFGIYRPMMALLAHPIKTFKTHMKLLLPVVIGWGAGFVGLARVVKWVFESNYNIAVWLFIGLIAGMMPSLFKEAGKKGRPVSAWVTLAISTVAIFGFLFFLANSQSINTQPNIFWFFVCGIFWGISLVFPGMSSSSILIFLRLYEPLAAGIGSLSPGVIIPWAIGMLFVLLVSVRAINYLFDRHYPIAFNMILGFVIATTLVIVPLNFKSVTEVVFCVICFAAGFVIAWLMDKLGDKIKPKDEEEPADKKVSEEA